MSIISRRDVAELLELVDAAFDEIAFSILALVELNVPDPVGFRRNDGRTVLIFNQLPDPICVVALVGKKASARRQVLQEKLGHRRVMHVAWREFELQGKAIAVHPQMQLRRQSSSTTTDTSISTLFFWAAAC